MPESWRDHLRFGEKDFHTKTQYRDPVPGAAGDEEQVCYEPAHYARYSTLLKQINTRISLRVHLNGIWYCMLCAQSLDCNLPAARLCEPGVQPCFYKLTFVPLANSATHFRRHSLHTETVSYNLYCCLLVQFLKNPTSTHLRVRDMANLRFVALACAAAAVLGLPDSSLVNTSEITWSGPESKGASRCMR